MCGLSGFWEARGARGPEQLVRLAEAMAATVAHRGPDSSDSWTDPGAGFALGHRRLAVLDRSPAGHQPMVSASGRFVLAYNGEIYNFRELKTELERHRRAFRGHSDSEVLLEACDLWGVEAAVERLVGMFAFALWDRERRALTLVRDRLGIKPLYWGRTGGCLFFGSQPKSFFPHPAWKPEVDRTALAVYLRFAYVPAPFSIYAGISQVRPGHMVTIEADGRVRDTCYWDLPAIAARAAGERRARDEGAAVEGLEAVLRDAVGRRMVADVPLGAFLSGGLDSSTVVALMQAQSERPVKSFAIGFREGSYNEAEQAAAVARHLGCEHTELYAEPGHALELIPELPEYYDEPFADSSQIPTLLISRLAREHVTVALTGDGGDELFAGYTRYLMANRLRLLFRLLPWWLRRGMAGALQAVSPQAWDRLLAVLPAPRRLPLSGDRLHKLGDVLRLHGFGHVYPLLVSQWQTQVELVPGEGADPLLFDERLAAPGPYSSVEHMQLWDMLTYLPNDILAKVDRASMSCGLEVRVPLLDHRVVEYTWSLPSALKLRGAETKWALRRILYRHVPADLVDRPKMGFGVPIDEWLRGPLREWAEELLSERSLGEAGLFNVPFIRGYWHEHLSGSRNRQHALWTVLMAQAWRYRWLEARTGARRARQAAGS